MLCKPQLPQCMVWKGTCAVTSRPAKVRLWDHQLVVPSCTLLTLLCCLVCGKRKQHWCEKIFLRNFILHFREPLCFKSWLLLQVEERTKSPTVYQVYLKKTLIFISNLFICMCFNIFLDLPSFILKEFGRE